MLISCHVLRRQSQQPDMTCVLLMVGKRAVQQCTQVPTQTAVISAMSDRKRTVNAMQRPGGDRNPPKATDAPSSCPALNVL
jgi:hypothetical protein